MRTALSILLFVAAASGSEDAAGRVSSRDGNIYLQDSSGREARLTSTGLDSEPWLSFDGRTVVFLRYPPGDSSRNSVYAVNVQDRKVRLLLSSPASYLGRRPCYYFGRPQLDESRRTLFLVAHEYATSGALLAVDLPSGTIRLISDGVVGYDVIACREHRGQLIALKRHPNIYGFPDHFYWLYSAEGKELMLAGTASLDLQPLLSEDCGKEDTPPRSAPRAPKSPLVDTALRVEAGEMEERLQKRVEPVYPAEVAAGKVQGEVVLQVYVAADGSVERVNLVSGPPKLAGAAMEAVKQWQFRPTLVQGKPTPVMTTVKLRR